MDPKQQNSDNYDEPVAYDTQGRPLYAHPAKPAEAMIATQAVHMTRPIEMKKPFISDATLIKHNQSKQLYPGLNLSEGEYVIASVPRHPIGILRQLIISMVVIFLALLILFNYDFVSDALQLSGPIANISIAGLIILLVIVLVCLFMYVSYFVYNSNKFFLTNESIIEHIQRGLFNRREQTISLASIEDASYLQEGLLEELVDYGSIRLSTVGDETTYRFRYVAHPKQVIDTLNNAVESFKNGRPVTRT